MDDPIPAKVPSRWPIALGWWAPSRPCCRRHRAPVRADADAKPIRPGVSPAASGPISYVVGTATAGRCPVERAAAFLGAPRPVAGAVVIASFAGRGEIAWATTAAGRKLPHHHHGYGTYTLTALPVAGLMNAPAPVTVTLDAFETGPVDFQYDTGIR